MPAGRRALPAPFTGCVVALVTGVAGDPSERSLAFGRDVAGKVLRVQRPGHLDHPAGDGLARVVVAGEVARHVAAAAVDAERLHEVPHLDLELRHHQPLEHGDGRALGDARLGRFRRLRRGRPARDRAARRPAASGGAAGRCRIASVIGPVRSRRHLRRGRALVAGVAGDPAEARLAARPACASGSTRVLSASVSSQHAPAGVLGALLVAGEVALHVAVVAFHAERFGHAPHLVAHLSAVQPVRTLMFSSGGSLRGGCALAAAPPSSDASRPGPAERAPRRRSFTSSRPR